MVAVKIDSRTLPRRSFLVGAAGVAGAATLATAGCGSLLPPSADPVVRAAWALSLRDADLLSGPAAEARAEQEGALSREVVRACGLREDGTSPEECVAAPDPLPAAPSPAGPADVLADARSSATLVDELGGRAAARDPYPANLLASVDGGLVLALRGLEVDWRELVPEPVEMDADDAAVFADALRAEYALVYGMGVAAPRVPGEYRQSTATSADRHRLLRDRVIGMAGGADVELPAAAPGYDVVDGAPDPETRAAEFAAHLEAACASAWRDAFIAAADPRARLFALQAAGLAHAGAAVFAGDGAAALPGLAG